MKTLGQFAVVLIAFVTLCLLVVGIAAAAGIVAALAYGAFTWGWNLT